MHILEKIVLKKREEVAARKAILSPSALEASISDSSKKRSLSSSIKASKYGGIIAEFKRKSPSRDNIFKQAKVRDIIPVYEDANAAGVSVLTDASFFGAKATDFFDARAICTLPMLQKDFIIDRYQIYEAKAMGADAILLISAILTAKEVKEYCLLAHQLGLECLYEIHNLEELKSYHEAIDIIGVNNRNLDTFITDFKTSIDLYDKLPTAATKISESGILSDETLTALQEVGYDGFLIGEWFMKRQKEKQINQ